MGIFDALFGGFGGGGATLPPVGADPRGSFFGGLGFDPASGKIGAGANLNAGSTLMGSAQNALLGGKNAAGGAGPVDLAKLASGEPATDQPTNQNRLGGLFRMLGMAGGQQSTVSAAPQAGGQQAAPALFQLLQMMQKGGGR